MKKLLLMSLLASMFISCDKPGTSIQVLSSNENLPSHLKGLRADEVKLNENKGSIYVATLNNGITGLDYVSGKSTEYVVILGDGSKRTVIGKSIISETDSIIAIRK